MKLSALKKSVNLFCASAAFLVVATATMLAHAAEPTNIILVRHGQTDYNLQHRMQGNIDIPLNATGIAQAENLAQYLKNVPIDVFISSPLQRANNTGKMIAAYHNNAEVLVDARLTEINLGTWAGMYSKDVKAKYPKMENRFRHEPWHFKAPKGESIKTIGKRAAAALTDIAQKYPGKNVLVVAHSLVNPAALNVLLGLGVKHMRQFAQDNTSISVLRYTDGKWTLLTWNAIPHLDKIANGIPLNKK